MTGPADPWQLPTPPSGEAPHPQAPPYGQPAPPYGQPAPGWSPHGWPPAGPPGKVRPTGKAILLFFVTLGIYSYVYNYKVHSEMKAHSGRGVGGGVALLLTFVAGVAMPFVTPAEVGSLYARRGEREPVRGWTGLWVLLPTIGGYLALMIALVALAPGASSDPYAEPAPGTSSDGSWVPLALGFGTFVLVAIAGALVWFVRTNGALNRYWESLASR